MEDKSTTKGMVTGTGPGAAVEVEDKTITMTNWTRGKVTSMRRVIEHYQFAILYNNFLNKYWKLFTFCHFSGRVRDNL